MVGKVDSQRTLTTLPDSSFPLLNLRLLDTSNNTTPELTGGTQSQSLAVDLMRQLARGAEH